LLDEARRVAKAAVITVVPPSATANGPLFHVEWQMNGQKQASEKVSIIISEYLDEHQKARYLAALQCSLPHGFDGELVFAGQCADAAESEYSRNPAAYASACNRAAARATGEVLIFLNGLSVPLDGWLPPLLDAIRSHPRAGALGGKVLTADGRIDHAGGLVFSDASLAGFGRGDWTVDDPLYGYLRQVDYSGDTVLVTRRALFEELGGFQPAYLSSPYSHADYCIQARGRDYAVYYQPESTFVLLPEQSQQASPSISGMNGTGDRELFSSRWRHVLKQQPFPRPWHDRDTWHALAVHTAPAMEVNR
jgi:hypothetical protein